jgi:hypothetical protein
MKDCIIEALANPEKERMKHDDTTISSWLQSKYFYFPKDEITVGNSYYPLYCYLCLEFFRSFFVKRLSEYLVLQSVQVLGSLRFI